MQTVIKRKPENFPEGDLTKEELNNWISKVQVEYDDLDCVSDLEYFFSYNSEDKTLPYNYTVSKIEQVGGEGKGEHYHVIYKLLDQNNLKGYFMYRGFYSSWDGVDWEDEAFIVTPVQVNTIRFEVK